MSNNLKGIRRNEGIRAREVRVIDPEGKQLGVLQTQDAIRMARNWGVDLIEIAPNANPPVCRIMDFGKFRYEISKKEREQHKGSGTKLKEVKFRTRIEQNDYMTKLRRAEGFLLQGHKLKLTLSFRGREMGHTELGMEVVKRALADLAHVATPDNTPRLAGKAINVMMSPLPTSKRKAKYTAEGDEIVDDVEETEGEDTE